MYFLNKGNSAVLYHDLRPIQDDKVVLTNPYKGWYIHFLDGGKSCPAYRTDIPEGDYLEEIPGLNMIYLRLTWTDIEKAPGVYDWSYVDDLMERWGSHGYTFAFRFITYMGLQDCDATPTWVFDAGANHYLHNGPDAKPEDKFYKTYQNMTIPVREPDYEDTIFLEYLDGFLAECGRKLNGHPLVEYIDVGTLGTWGEMHWCESCMTHYGLSTYKKHADLHLRHFPDTRIMMNDDAICTGKGRLKEESGELEWFAEYCVNMGMGLRDDSIAFDGGFRQNGYDTLRVVDLYQRFNRHAPVDLEFCHYDHAKKYMRSGYTEIEAAKNSGATRAGYHAYTKEWYENHKDLHDYLANRLGYWYFPEGYTLPEKMISGVPAYMELTVSNRGYAPAYHKFDLKVALEDTQGNLFMVSEGYGDNTRWLPGEKSREWIKLTLKNVPAGEYKVLLGLFYRESPILLGLKKEIYCDGYYEIGGVTVEP